MSATVTYALPEEFQQSLYWLMEASIWVLESGQETELAGWARLVRERFNSEDVQEQLTRDLDAAAAGLGGPAVANGEREGQPIAYALLAEEFAAFSRRPEVAQPEYSGVDHSLDLGEILIDSLGRLIQGHPFGAAIVSLIKEMIQMAKSAGKRLGT